MSAAASSWASLNLTTRIPGVHHNASAKNKNNTLSRTRKRVNVSGDFRDSSINNHSHSHSCMIHDVIVTELIWQPKPTFVYLNWMFECCSVVSVLHNHGSQ